MPENFIVADGVTYDEPPDDVVACENCGVEHPEHDLVPQMMGDPVCESCIDVQPTFWCATCDEDHFDADEFSFNVDDDDMVSVTVRLVRSRQVVTVNGNDWCDENPPLCPDCDRSIADAEYWVPGDRCWRCGDDRGYGRARLHDWNYMPALRFKEAQDDDTFLRPTPRSMVPYMGIELEMEDARPNLSDLHRLFEEPEFGWLKHDGSLMDDGVELVTHPATFEWYMANFPWDHLEEAVKLGAQSFGPGTCGIHIHISQTAFTKSHLYKFLGFHIKNAQVCQGVGQRRDATYSRWTDFVSGRRNLIEQVKAGYPTPHYNSVSISEKGTLELRYFRGNLKASRVRKNLQWVDAVYHYTKTIPVMEIDRGLRFSMMLPWLEAREGRYPDLVPFVHERIVGKDRAEYVLARDLGNA